MTTRLEAAAQLRELVEVHAFGLSQRQTLMRCDLLEWARMAEVASMRSLREWTRSAVAKAEGGSVERAVYEIARGIVEAVERENGDTDTR